MCSSWPSAVLYSARTCTCPPSITPLVVWINWLSGGYRFIGYDTRNADSLINPCRGQFIHRQSVLSSFQLTHLTSLQAWVSCLENDDGKERSISDEDKSRAPHAIDTRVYNCKVRRRKTSNMWGTGEFVTIFPNDLIENEEPTGKQRKYERI